jgi:ABC-2 type transport system permease protein
MNIFKLTSIELNKYWQKKFNYLGILVIAVLSVLTTLFLNGVFAFILGNAGESQLNTLSFNQLTNVLSVAWFFVLMYYSVQQLNNYLLQDVNLNIEQLVFTKPINSFQYASSKILFGFIQSLIFGLTSTVAIIITSIIVNPKTYQLQDNYINILSFVLWYALPLHIVTGILTCVLTLKLKSKTATYILYGILLMLPIIISALFSGLSTIYNVLTWSDPTGGLLYSENIKYYTTTEINKSAIGLNFIINRIVWVVGCVLLALFTASRFSFETISNIKAEKIEPITPFTKTSTKPNSQTMINQLLIQFKFFFFRNFKKPALYILTSVCVGYFSFYAFTNFSTTKIASYPTTTSITIWIAASTFLYSIIYIGYRIGSLYEVEKVARVDNLLSATSTSNITLYLSKVSTVLCEVSIVSLFVTCLGIMAQYLLKSPVKQPLELIFGWVLLTLLYFVYICFTWTIVTIFNQSKLAYAGVVISFIIPLIISGFFKFDSNLIDPRKFGSLFTDDFAGIGYAVDGYLISRIYWFSISVMMLIGALYIGIKRDNQILKFRSSKLLSVFFPIVGIVILLSGSLLVYANYLQPADKSQFKQASQYIKAYEGLAGKDNLTLIKSNLTYNLYPSQAKYDIKGVYTLTNKSKNPITSILLDTYDDFIFKNFSFSTPYFQTSHNKDLGVRLVDFKTPIAIDQEITMDFEIAYNRVLFSDYDKIEVRSIQKNGTFLDTTVLPTLGFNFGKIASEPSLLTRDLKNKIDERDTSKNIFSGFANIIEATTTITTDQDQKAIAPGKLESETVESGRNKYVYKNPKMLFFLNVMSGKYANKTFDVDGIKVDIFFNPDHTANIEEISMATKDSIQYYNKVYGRYPLDYLRIVEFGSGQYAQSFAGSITIGDSIFIAKVEDKPSSLNIPYWITAHEVAHQWWGHQLIASQGKGSSFLTESLAEYSSNQVLQNRYGVEKFNVYKKDNLDTYLKNRKKFISESTESPLAEVGYTDDQLFVHYQKGSVVLDSISKLMTREKLDEILRQYILSNKQNPPFANSRDLENTLIASSKPEYKEYITELLNQVTTYDNKIISVKTEFKDNKYISNIELEFNKKKVEGFESKDSTITPQSPIKISLYENKTSNKPIDGKLIISQEIKIVSPKQSLTIITDQSPDLFVLDNDLLYIDRDLKNNISGKKSSTFNDILAEVLESLELSK